MKNIATVIAMAAVTVVVGIGVVGYAFGRMIGDHSNTRSFNRQVWLSAANNTRGDSPRGEMIGDLRDHRLKTGMSRKQITDLLGVPNQKVACKYVYRLGNRVGCQLCPDFLEISFDKRGIVSRIHVREM